MTVLFSLGFQSLLFIKLWLIPLIISAEAAHFAMELPEHFKCNKETRDVMQNTRTIKGCWFSQRLTNFNNFHIEHHWFPKLPLKHLPTIHHMVSRFSQNVVCSYWDFFSDLIRSFVREAGASQEKNQR